VNGKYKKVLILLICFLLGPLGAEGIVFFPKKRTVEQLEEKIAGLPEEGRLKTKATLYSRLGTLLYKEGKFKKAAEAFEVSLTYKTSRTMRKHIYLYLGKSYESYARLDKAISAYEMAAKYDKRNWRRHRDLAVLLEKVKLYHKAIDSYETALSRTRKKPHLHFQLGRTWGKRGIYSKAEEHLLRAKELGQKDQPLYRELSRIYEGQGRFTDAVLAFEKVLGDGSPPKDWAKIIYLSILAGKKTFANQGMDQLRKMQLSEGTLQFYESLVLFTGKKYK